MSLDTLPLAIAGRLFTRRHKRNTERGHRSDDAILRWPNQLRGTPVAEELATRAWTLPAGGATDDEIQQWADNGVAIDDQTTTTGEKDQ